MDSPFANSSVDQSDVDEVMSSYGRAMFGCQCIERILAMLLATVYRDELYSRARWLDYEQLMALNFHKPLGALLGEMREKGVAFPSELESLLQEALRNRNYLAHFYFSDREVLRGIRYGEKAWRPELEQMARLFQSVADRLWAIEKSWMQKQGVSEEMIWEAWNDYLRDDGGGEKA
jgi:hypothetical protein